MVKLCTTVWTKSKTLMYITRQHGPRMSSSDMVSVKSTAFLSMCIGYMLGSALEVITGCYFKAEMLITEASL